MVMGKMNPRRFLKEFASTNEISNAELEELATGLVSRGLGEK